MLWSHFRKLNKWMNELKLTDAEKRSGRLVVVEYINDHPAMSRQTVILPLKNKFSYKLFLIPKFMIPAILILAVALSGGTVAAAQNALPGEALYVVKTEINESVQGAFKWSEEKQADFLEKLIEKRLDERAKLIETNKITLALEEKVAEQIAKHVNKTKKLVVKLEKRGNDVAAEAVLGKLDNYLEARQDALEKSGEAKAELKEKVAELKKEIEEKQAAVALKVAERQKEAGGNSLAVEQAAKVHLDNFAGKIADVKSLFADKKVGLTAEQIKAVEEKLAAADKSFAEAKVKFEAKQYFEALKLTLASHKELITARQLIVMKNWEKKVEAKEAELKEKAEEKAAEVKLKAEEKTAEIKLKAAEKEAEIKVKVEEKAAELKEKQEEKLKKAEEKTAELKAKQEEKLKETEDKVEAKD